MLSNIQRKELDLAATSQETLVNRSVKAVDNPINKDRGVSLMIGNPTIFRSLAQGLATILTATLLISGVAIAANKDELPQTTVDGLTLTKQTKERVVYLADDVDFGSYTKVMIVDCAVSFAKNWQRDYNRQERDLSRQVRDQDVTRIKNNLAAEFKKVFTQTMTERGIEVVSEPASDVIILRPAIVNLVVNAPDVRSTSMSRTYVSSAGAMTLYLELYDSVSSAILAKVLDAQAARRNSGMGGSSNRVTNTKAADRILKSWANELADNFGVVKNPDAEAEINAKAEARNKE